MSITAWTSTVAVEANGVRVLTLLLSTITYEMFFTESNMSCTIERFFLGFLWIPLKKWTPLAKLFPLFTTGLALDNDGPSTSIKSTSTKGWHWGSTNSLLSVESLDPSVHSFGISPLGVHAFFPLQPCLQTWFSWNQHSTNRCGKWLMPWDMSTRVQPIITTQYNCK